MPTYTYEPALVGEHGKDRMRLELGDTTLCPGELTAALTDEEYIALINSNPSWKKAKMACLRAILMRFAHQVNISHDGISYSFSDRVKFWKELYDEEKKKMSSAAVPSVHSGSLSNVHGGHYFYEDMHKNW